jgi:hypothetical protein
MGLALEEGGRAVPVTVKVEVQEEIVFFLAKERLSIE